MRTDQSYLNLLHTLLEPFGRVLYRHQIRTVWVKAVNRLAWLLPAVSMSIWIVWAFSTLFTLRPGGLYTLVVFGGISYWTALIVTGIVRRPGWAATARRVDAVTNTDNIVAIALEHSKKPQPSLFAKHAIYKGGVVLNNVPPDRIRPSCVGVARRRLVCGATAAVLIWGLSFGIYPPDGSAVWTDRQHGGSVAAALETNEQATDNDKRSDPLSVATASFSVSQATRDRPIRSDSPSESDLWRFSANPDSTLSQGSGRNPVGGRFHSALTAQSDGGVSARNRDTSSNETGTDNSTKADQTRSDRTDPHRLDDTFGQSGQPGSAGSSPYAESDLQAMAAAGGLQDFFELEDAFSDRQQARPDERADLSRRPQLSDGKTAPNRELGMSGKPGDAFGDARGGPGPVKQSRVTASSLTAATISLQVRGQTQPGQSKSYAQALPFSAAASPMSEPEAEFSEPRQTELWRYIPNPDQQTIIERYFEYLRDADF